MAITGIGSPTTDALDQYQTHADVVHTQSAEKATAVNSTAVFKGKVSICAGGSCVRVHAGETGLTQQQMDTFAQAFHNFIISNPGADLTTSGTAVFGGARGGSREDENFVRVTAQFVGYKLPQSWNSNEVRTIIYAGSASELQMSSGTAGKLDRSWVRDRTPQTEYTVRLNMGWKDHRTNPSGLARTMIHEYLHREDELGFSGGRLVTKEHQKLDERARSLLSEFGLSGGGCQSAGDSFFPWIAPSYPGCETK